MKQLSILLDQYEDLLLKLHHLQSEREEFVRKLARQFLELAARLG